eukprot:sb/3470499/
MFDLSLQTAIMQIPYYPVILTLHQTPSTRSGRLDHPEFKACLRSLGFDLPVPVEGEPDVAFEAILDYVDRDRDGFVRLEEYMQVHKLAPHCYYFIANVNSVVAMVTQCPSCYNGNHGNTPPQFMISRTTENVAGTDELTEAFRALTEGGDKPYITATELYSAMPSDQAKYCIDRMDKYPDVPGALDYTNFTKAIFQLNTSVNSG